MTKIKQTENVNKKLFLDNDKKERKKEKLDNKSIWGISIAGITKILDKIYTILSKKYMYNPMNTIYLANT